MTNAAPVEQNEQCQNGCSPGECDPVDFLGVKERDDKYRAQIIDKDRTPHWRHAGPDTVTKQDIEDILTPLGDDALRFSEG